MNKLKFSLAALFFFSMSVFASNLNNENISIPTNRGHPEVSRAAEFHNNLKEPYYIVIFDIDLNEHKDSYFSLGSEMLDIAKTMPGYIDATSMVSGNRQIVLCSWRSLEAIQNWYDNAEHIKAQKLGETKYFEKLRLRIAKVERDYTHIIKK